MKFKIIVFDANALGHVVKHSTKELSFAGNKTGVIFGFLQKMMKIQEEVMADHVVFCWDGNKSELFRRQVFPGYKSKSEEKSEIDKNLDMIARIQFSLLRTEVLPKLGFNNQLIYHGLEADDIIAQISLDYKENFDIIIVSRDNDLHQLLTGSSVMIFDPVKMGYFTEKVFIDKWGITPDKWDVVKSIIGCSGDDVPGVPGVKEKTAIKFLQGTLPTTNKKYADIVNSSDICIRNMRLVKLPWESTPNFTVLQDSISVDGFIEICMQYGLNSFLEGGKFNDFQNLFKRS